MKTTRERRDRWHRYFNKETVSQPNTWFLDMPLMLADADELATTMRRSAVLEDENERLSAGIQDAHRAGKAAGIEAAIAANQGLRREIAKLNDLVDGYRQRAFNEDKLKGELTTLRAGLEKLFRCDTAPLAPGDDGRFVLWSDIQALIDGAP